MPEITYYDRYGRSMGSVPSLPGKIVPYISEQAGGGITYNRFFPDDSNGKCAIQRVTEESSGGTKTQTFEHTYGAWDDRATLTYYPINQAIPVTEE